MRCLEKICTHSRAYHFAQKSNRKFFRLRKNRHQALSQPPDCTPHMLVVTPDMLPGSYQAGQPGGTKTYAALCLQSPGSSRLAPFPNKGRSIKISNQALLVNDYFRYFSFYFGYFSFYLRNLCFCAVV